MISLFKKSLFAALVGGALFSGSAVAADPVHLKIGVRGGVGEQAAEVAAEVGKRYGLDIELVVMSQTLSPNEALNVGDLDANAFQHIPFFNDQVKQRGYKLAPVGVTYLSPIAFYSKKYKSLEELPQGAKVGVPDDFTNESRALILLRDHGLITLKDGFDPTKDLATLADVASNPRNIEIVEAKAVVLARSYEDLDAAATNSSYASQVGLNPTRDGIALEKVENNPNVNIIVVREADKDAPWVAPLVASFQSEEVRKFMENDSNGALIPAF